MREPNHQSGPWAIIVVCAGALPGFLGGVRVEPLSQLADSSFDAAQDERLSP